MNLHQKCDERTFGAKSFFLRLVRALEARSQDSSLAGEPYTHMPRGEVLARRRTRKDPLVYNIYTYLPIGRGMYIEVPRKPGISTTELIDRIASRLAVDYKDHALPSGRKPAATVVKEMENQHERQKNK